MTGIPTLTAVRAHAAALGDGFDADAAVVVEVDPVGLPWAGHGEPRRLVASRDSGTPPQEPVTFTLWTVDEQMDARSEFRLAGDLSPLDRLQRTAADPRVFLCRPDPSPGSDSPWTEPDLLRRAWAVVLPSPAIAALSVQADEPPQQPLVSSLVWLAVTGIALDQPDAVHRARMLSLLDPQRQAAAVQVLDAAWLRARAVVPPDAAARLVAAASRAAAPPGVDEVLADGVARTAAAAEGPETAMHAAVFLLSVVARLAASEGWAPRATVTSMVAGWMRGRDEGWVWPALAVPLSVYDDALPANFLLDRTGDPVGPLFWWLHALASLLTGAARRRGGANALLTELRSVDVRPVDGRLPWLEVSTAALFGEDDRYGYRFPRVCNEPSDWDGSDEVDCASCRAAGTVLSGVWPLTDVARASVWVLLMLSDVAATAAGLAPGDPGWREQRRAFLNSFTVRLQALVDGSRALR